MSKLRLKSVRKLAPVEIVKKQIQDSNLSVSDSKALRYPEFLKLRLY